MRKILIFLLLMLIPAGVYAYTSFDGITISGNNPIKLNTQEIYSLPTYGHTTIQAINPGPTRLYLMPKGNISSGLSSGIKLFQTEYSSSQPNYFDAGFYVTDESIRFNSKRNGTYPNQLPFKWSFQDVDVKMTLDQYGNLSATKFTGDGSALTGISCDKQVIRDIVNEILAESGETTPIEEPVQSPTSGLVSHYLFDGNTNDETGVYNGQVFGATNNGDAYVFNGDDYIENGLLSTSEFTYMFDFEINQDRSGALIAKYDGVSKIQQLYYDEASNKVKFDFGQVGGVRNIIYSSPILLNTRYKVAVSWDGVTSKIYINGVLQNSSTILASDFVDSILLDIGRRNNDGSYFNGKIYEAKFYNEALDISDINNF